MAEQWRAVVGFDGLYEASSLGAIRALSRVGTYRGRWGDARMRFPARLMKLYATKTGYLTVALKRVNLPAQTKLVHKLVTEAFFAPPGPGQQVNHKDGDKANNRLENLEYCTASQNLRHCIDTLGKKRGEHLSFAKLTESDVRNIRGDSRTLKEIAQDYGVSLQSIHYIKKRKHWKHVA